MNKEQIIEEMANDMNKHCVDLSHTFCGIKNCTSCISTALYNASYRKERQVVEETVDRMVEMLKNRIHNQFAYHGWYLKETIIEEIAKEMRGE